MNWTVKVRPDVWVDPRFRLLERKCLSRWEAMGKLVEFWMHAQNHWAEDEPMPFKKFDLLGFPELIECGLAEILPCGGVRAIGGDEHFNWIKSQRERSKKGHAARYGPTSPSSPSMPQAGPKHAPAMPTAALALAQAQALALARELNTSFVLSPPAKATCDESKKICDSKSDISHSDPHDSESFPSEGSNPAAVESLGVNLCRGSQQVKESTDGDAKPLKSDLPEVHAMVVKAPSPGDLSRVWNEHRGVLPKVLKVTGDRERKARARLREEPDLGQWKDAIIKLSHWEWGTGHNDSGWMADFDYLLRPGTMVKASEGFFDAKTPKAAKKSDGISDEFIEQLARKYGNAEHNRS